jgi:hypothetical protein
MTQQTLRQMAQDAKEVQTQNIADAGIFPIDIAIETKEFTKTDGETFTVNIAVVNEVPYRVPTSVLLQLKALLEDMPELQQVKVLKTGSGMSTQYQVVPK